MDSRSLLMILAVDMILCFNGSFAQTSDWQLVFRAVAGVSVPDPHDLWVSDMALNENNPDACELTDDFQGHYKSSIAMHWEALDIDEVRVSLYTAGAAVKELIFDGSGSTKTSWFDVLRLTSSPWTDLSSSTTGLQSFSVTGTDNGDVKRRFLIHETYGGCPTDAGWLSMTMETGNCAWDRPAGIAYPFFAYADSASSIVWQSAAGANIGYADIFTIFIKIRNPDTPPLSISCVDTCVIPESGGVINIQISGIGFGLINVQRRRKKRAATTSTNEEYQDLMTSSRRKRGFSLPGTFLYIDSIVVRTTKGSSDTADALKDYAPVLFETEEFLTLPVEIVDDNLVEGDETFTVQIFRVIFEDDSSIPADSYSVTVTIKDDDVSAPPPADPVPLFSLDKFIYPVRESIGSVKVTVRRHIDTTRQQNIVLYTANIDAASPNDYENTSVLLEFQPGETEQFHDIPIVNDDVLEDMECFTVTLQDPDDGNLGTPATATVMIKDDDVTYSFTRNSFVAYKTDETVEIGIVRTGFLGQPSSVEMRSTDKTASSRFSGRDFDSFDDTIHFGYDESVAYVGINIVRDSVFDPEEYFTLQLHSYKPTEIIEPAVATVTIESDEALCKPPCLNGGFCSDEDTCLCANGFIGSLCEVALKQVAGRLILERVNGNEAVYESSLSNPYSQQYQELENMVVTELTKVFSSRLSGFRSVKVEAFSKGSIVVEYTVLVDRSSSVVEETVMKEVKAETNSNGFLGDSFLKLTPNARIDLCPVGHCLNRGICSANEGTYRCMCSEGFTGNRCEIPLKEIASPSNQASIQTDESPSGISDAMVTVIVMASFMILLVVLSTIACFSYLLRGRIMDQKEINPLPHAFDNQGVQISREVQTPFSDQNQVVMAF